MCKFIISAIFLVVVLPHTRMSLSLQNRLTGTDSLDLKFCKGSSITTKEDNLRFTIETPLSDVLTFHLAVDNILRIFPIFQERKQTNDYNVLSVNNTIYIIKNGQVINETESSTLKEISVEFASSEDVLWTVFDVRGNGSGKDLEVDCSSLDSVQYAFEDLQVVKNDTFLVNEDNVRFLFYSPTAGNLSFHLIVENNLPVQFLIWEEGHRLNHYNVLYLNNTICIIQNGYVLEEADSYAPKQIYLKFWSKQESFYTFFKECGHETRKSCDIQCQTCKNVETSTEFSKEHVTIANDNTMHEDNFENQNSDDSENIQKCSDCNTESTDSSTGSSTFSSTESSTKAPPKKNNHILIIISVTSVIVVIIIMIVAYKRCKSNPTENKKEEQKLKQENANDSD
ncbi:uncharacterized protein [Tenebrio molitor]|uniref:uncharacterized protein isoform X2 n=1 Tax=Tenebrio molitor TaxID=7067 RepID=UPI0036246F13